MRIAIYARKSTESDDRQVQSLEDQIRGLTALANREGLRITEIFQEAHSAKEPDTRPEFRRLLLAIKEGSINAILTWSINRLSRNAVDGGYIAHMLQSGKIEFIQTIDRTYRPNDNAVLLSIENGMSISFLQDLRRDVSRGMRGKVERGWHTCKPPIGYKNDREKREIVPDLERFKLVRRAWDLMLQDAFTVAEVHQQLLAQGLTVPTRRRKPKLISRAKLYQILNDRFYIGEILYKGETYPGKHQPMITEDEFDFVRSRFRDRNKLKKPRPLSFPLAGAIRCAICGCAIVGEEKRKHYPRTRRTAHYIYYHCSGSKGCSKAGIREETLNEKVEARLLKFRLTEDTAAWLKNALLHSVEKDAGSTAHDVSRLEAERRVEESRLKEFTLMRSGGEITSEEYLSFRNEALGVLANLRERLSSARTTATRILELLYLRIDSAVAAGELSLGELNLPVLSNVLRSGGIHRLNLITFDFRLDSILEKITTLEPPNEESESPKLGDLVPFNSFWWALVSDLRTIATDQIRCNDFLDAQRTPSERAWEQRREVQRLRLVRECADFGGGILGDERMVS